MKLFFLIFFLIFSLHAKEKLNDLQYETSPYLQAHKTNPVEWMPWGKKAFAKARKEHKAVFLSIGYSTCHWCHVMEEESFSNKKIAKLFNKYFVAIKVDREEMPDIDAYYQNIFLKMHHRSGGWPLSIFMSPEKKVFYSAGYLPAIKKSYSEGLETLLPHLGKLYKSDSKEYKILMKKAETSINAPVVYEKQKHGKISLEALKNSLLKEYDDIYGGFGNGRKFPEVSKLILMFNVALLSRDRELQNDVYETLDAMALGGLYDQVEGGFFRYSVDESWKIPHFEKMLYTQAELIPLYTRAYLLTKKQLYKDVVLETIGMLDKYYKKDNLYYSASDADSGEEGAYFLYSKSEIAQTPLKFVDNFEGKMHINIYENRRPKDFKKIQKKLQKFREKRVYPFIDKKINTAWNSMMIEALYSASVIDVKYAKQAEKTLLSLEDLMYHNHTLYHQTILGTFPKQKALLEDYSFLIGALLEAYEVDYDAQKLSFAEYLLQESKSLFYKNGIWYLSQSKLNIKAGLIDKYYISPLAKMLQNILKLATLKESFRYEKLARTLLKTLEPQLQEKLALTPALATAYLMQKKKFVLLKSNLKNLEKNRAKIERINYPFVLKEVKNFDDYLACTLRQCFSKDEDLKVVIKAIEKK